jgi:hypothetical protein
MTAETATASGGASARRENRRAERGRRAWGRQALIGLTGLFCLAAGVLEYLTGRGGEVYFLEPLPGLAAAFRGLPSPFGAWGTVAPDFLHAMGIALLAMAAAPPSRRARRWICAVWLLIAAGFEAGQAAGARAAALLPAWLQGLPVLGRLGDYFVRGVFDPADLAAAFLGVAAAFGIGELLLRRPAAPGFIRRSASRSWRSGSRP